MKTKLKKAVAPKKAAVKSNIKSKPAKLDVKAKSVAKSTAASKSTEVKKPKATHVKVTAFKEKVKVPVADNIHYMTPKHLDHFRALLLNWKRDLMAGVDKTIHHMQDEAANFADPNDRATQEEEFSLELRTRDRERKLMGKIDEALEKIDNGDYGYCEECGIEIGIQRLQARPTATLCIDCKTLDEIREKQVAG